MRRVALTGAGTVNALGLDVPATFAALTAGRTAIAPLDLPGREFSPRPGLEPGPLPEQEAPAQGRGGLSDQVLGAAVQGFDPAQHFQPQQLARMDRFSQFALVAARQAMAQAGLGPCPAAGVIIGTAGGGLTTSEEAYRRVFAGGASAVSPLTAPRMMPNAAAAHISMAFGLTGPAFSISSACASSNHAIGLAAQMIRWGAAPMMLAGGADAMLTFGGLKVWQGLRLLSPDGCRPFAADRNGMVLGEGSAVFVLEDMDHARARGAPVLAEVAGWAMGADAADLVAPSPAGAERAMRAALADAGLAPADIHYLNAHGTGTRANDAAEAEAIMRVFGAHGPPVSSTKALHGHAMGATGAIELLACLMALDGGLIAPMPAPLTPDPACGLRLVIGQPQQADVRATLSNGFGFGGMNATLILTQR